MMIRRRYRNREEAGAILAEYLAHLKIEPDLVVLGIPRGGVVVAAVVAHALKAPLDLLPARKIGAPGNPEFAIGAVAGDTEYIDQDLIKRLGIPERYVQSELARQRELSLAQGRRLRGTREPIDISGKTVIVIDDGVATGATVLAALRALRKKGPRRLILAVPVGPMDSIETLRQVADEVVCPLVPEWFWSVGSHYENFEQVSDEEVIALLGGTDRKSAKEERDE